MISLKTVIKNNTQPSGRLANKLFIAIGLFSFLLYSNAIPNGYNLDDELVTIHHRLTSKGIAAIPQIFASPYYQDNAGNAYEYRPVTLASFAIEHQLFGDNVYISHLINVLLYVLLCLFILKTLCNLFNHYNRILPLVITLLFISHPVHTEVVAGIKNRDELLCLLGGILSLYHAIKFADNKKIVNFLLLIVFFVLAVLSKKSIIPFAIIIPVSLILFRQIEIRHIVLISFALALVSGVFWPFNHLYQKVFFSTGLFLFPITIYSINNRQELMHYLHNLFSGLKGRSQVIELNESMDQGFDMSKMQVLLIPLTLIISSLVIYYNLKVLAVIYLTFLSGLYMLSTQKSNQHIILNMFILFALVSIFFRINHFWVLPYFISMIYIYSGKKIRYMGIVFLLFCLIALLVFEKKLLLGFLFGLPLLATLFYFLFKRSDKWSYIGLFSAFVLIEGGLDYPISLKTIILLLVLVSFILLKIKNIFSTRMALRLLIIFQFPLFIYSLHLAGWHEVPRVYANYVLKHNNEAPVFFHENISIIPASGRELNYVETPIKSTDPLSLRIGTSATVLGKYAALMFFPHPLKFYYGYAEIKPVPWNDAYSIISLIFYALIVTLGIYFFAKHPIISFGIFSYCLSIVIFSNFVAPLAGLMADRLAFVSSFGFCIAIGYLLVIILKIDVLNTNIAISFRNKKWLLLGIIITAYSAKTFARNFQWKNHLTLMGGDIEHLDQSVQANNLYAVHLVKKSFENKSSVEREKLLNKAVNHFSKAVEIYPKADFIWYDLGRTHLLLTNYQQALYSFLKAAQLDTSYIDAWMNAGAIFIQQKKFQDAAYCFQKIISTDSTNIQAYTSLSQSYFLQNKFQESIEVNLEIIKLVPNAYDPIVNIGKTYFTMGDKKNALLYFEKAYQINPSDRNLVLTMANIYKEFGENQRAEFYFSKSNQINR